MEISSNTNKGTIRFYEKVGVLFTILPYLGGYEKWNKVMNLTCKRSQQTWNTNQFALQELNRLTKWKISEALKRLYKKHLHQEIEFNENL